MIEKPEVRHATVYQTDVYHQWEVRSIMERSNELAEQICQLNNYLREVVDAINKNSAIAAENELHVQKLSTRIVSLSDRVHNLEHLVSKLKGGE